MSVPTQPGITQPVPGQDKEEPELWDEDDIPVDHGDRPAASGDKRDHERERAHRGE
ncbi:MAG TPA: hypothetical protein VIE63_16015 [Ramlibacter sp.]